MADVEAIGALIRHSTINKRMKDILKSVGKTVKNVALTVWHVPAVESVAATLVIRWLSVAGISAPIATAIYEAAKAVIG